MKPVSKTAQVSRYDLVGDEFVPDPIVARAFNVTLMTLWRWDHDPELGFPPRIKIRNRNFRSRKALDAFKEKLVHDALARRTPPRNVPPRGAARRAHRRNAAEATP